MLYVSLQALAHISPFDVPAIQALVARYTIVSLCSNLAPAVLYNTYSSFSIDRGTTVREPALRLPHLINRDEDLIQLSIINYR